MRTAKEVGAIVRQLRGDMSLRDFGKKCGMSHTTIDNIEKGEDFRTGKPVQVKITTLKKIADACNVPVAYLMGEEETVTRDSVDSNIDNILQLTESAEESMIQMIMMKMPDVTEDQRETLRNLFTLPPDEFKRAMDMLNLLWKK